MRRVLYILLGILLVVSLAVGFILGTANATDQEDAPKGEGVVYYMAPTLFDEFQAGTKLMMETIGHELGYEVKVLNANNNAMKQIEQIDAAIAMKPRAIILNAVDSSTIVSSVDKAREEGIPVLVYDRFITETSVDFHSVVGTIKIGNMAADECTKLLKEKYGEERGVVLEIMGDSGDMYTVLIDKGFRDVMKKYPNVKVIVKDTPQWEPTTTASIVDDQLTARKDIDIIFFHADFRGTAIVPVLESHGYKKGEIALIGTDGAPTGLQLIRDGWMVETIAVPMVQQVWGIWTFIDEILAGEEIKAGTYNIKGVESELIIEKWGPTLYLPGEIITRDRVDDPGLWGNMKVEVKE